MLRFFHQACKPLINCADVVKPQDRLTLLGNVDVAIADAVYATTRLGGEVPSKVMREEMCMAGLPYFTDVGLPGKLDQLDNAVAISGWILPEFKRLHSSVEALRPSDGGA